MTIGERIKKRRLELHMSVDQVADQLNKNRATIYRYESNEIENFPIAILEPLAKVLQSSPIYLMGWDTMQYQTAASDQKILLEQFEKLNSKGQQEAVKRLKELTQLPCYTAKAEDAAPL